MDDANTIRARLRVLRELRDLSQKELADLAGLSQPFISQIERGRRVLDRRSHIAAIATALKVSEKDIVGGPHLSDDPIQSDPHTSIPALRAALETNSLRAPTIDRARPLSELVTEMTEHIKPAGLAADYTELGKHLPDVLDELHVHVASPADEAAHRLALETLIEACLRAGADAHLLGYPDLAHIAASRGAEAAAILDDPVQRGKAEFMRVLTMPRAGSWDRSLIAAERAANDLQPHATQPLDLQVLGMLTLTASLAAAAVRKGDTAKTWLGEASNLARHVPDNPVSNWERFSATNVGVWQVTIGVELGEAGGGVLEKAKTIKQNKLDPLRSRKAALLADVGRGLARDKKTRDEAVRWLRRAEDLAPQRIRNNGAVRHTVEVLRTQALDEAVGVELRGMCARMGIPH